MKILLKPYNISKSSQIGKRIGINVTAASASLALGWAVGFYAPPVPAVLAIFSAAGFYALYLGCAAIGELIERKLNADLQIAKDESGILKAHARLAKLREDIKRAKKHKKRHSHLEAEAAALMAKILRGA